MPSLRQWGPGGPAGPLVSPVTSLRLVINDHAKLTALPPRRRRPGWRVSGVSWGPWIAVLSLRVDKSSGRLRPGESNLSDA